MDLIGVIPRFRKNWEDVVVIDPSQGRDALFWVERSHKVVRCANRRCGFLHWSVKNRSVFIQIKPLGTITERCGNGVVEGAVNTRRDEERGTVIVNGTVEATALERIIGHFDRGTCDDVLNKGRQLSNGRLVDWGCGAVDAVCC